MLTFKYLRSVLALTAVLSGSACAELPEDSVPSSPEELAVKAQAVIVGANGTGSPGYTTSWWRFSSSTTAAYDSIEQALVPTNESPIKVFYFASTFYFQGSLAKPRPDYGPMGYMGLQTTPTGKQAIFSIWGAAGASSSGIARSFDGEGTGFQTIIPYAWEGGHIYTFRVTRTSAMYGAGYATTAWTAYVKDTSTGIEQAIGRILVPYTFGGLSSLVANFTEYFGDTQVCTSFLNVSSTTVAFGRPTANFGGVHNDSLPYSQTLEIARDDRPTCEGAASFSKAASGYGVYAFHRMFGRN